MESKNKNKTKKPLNSHRHREWTGGEQSWGWGGKMDEGDQKVQTPS